MKTESPEVQQLLMAMSPLINQADGRLDGRGLFMALNGLQGLNSNEKSVQVLLSALLPLLQNTLRRGFAGFEDFYQLSGAINGLSRLNSRDPGVKSFVETIAQLVKPKSDAALMSVKVSSERVGMALFGLQGLQRLPEAEDILSVLIPYIDAVPSLDGKTVGMSLQGFKACAPNPTPIQEKV